MRDPQPLPLDFCIQEVLEYEPDNVLKFMEKFGPLARPGDALSDLPAALYPRPGEDPDLPLEATNSEGVAIAISTCELHLRVLRTLAKMVLADPADPGAVLPAIASEGLLSLVPNNDTTRGAWSWWRMHVNAGLQRFPMHVRFADSDDPEPNVNQPTLYNAAILQLVEVETGDYAIAYCENERCPKSFTRQRSARRQYTGAEHATGVLYCSRRCAKAQSERVRRARRREERSQ